MSEFVYLVAVESEEDGPFVAVCGGGLPTTDHYVVLDNGAEGKVSHVIYIAEDSDEYRLIAAVAPIFQVDKLWHLDWRREASHADP